MILWLCGAKSERDRIMTVILYIGVAKTKYRKDGAVTTYLGMAKTEPQYLYIIIMTSAHDTLEHTAMFCSD